MKRKTVLQIITLTFVFSVFLNTSFAETQRDKGMMGNGYGMMNGGMMNTNQMQGMMHECMAMNKGTAACDNQMMEQCQKNQGKQVCRNILSEVKKLDAPTIKRK